MKVKIRNIYPEMCGREGRSSPTHFVSRMEAYLAIEHNVGA